MEKYRSSLGAASYSVAVGVEQNSELKRGNYGRISSNGICFWDGWSGCTRSFGKTNKDPKRKRNSRRELQGRVIHCSVPISHRGVVSNSDYSYYLCFTVSFRTNKLIYSPKYSKRQECLHTLIKYLHDEKGMGYRKISHFLNKSGIKTHRGNTFTNSSIHSILKRKKERDKRMVFRNKEYPVKIGKFELKYLRN